jgi:predicted RNase H-like HicB family nuclease
LITLAISPAQIILAVKATDKEQQESFVEDLLAATSQEYLASMREARQDYEAGQAHYRVPESIQLPVTVYQDEEGWYVVECPGVPGCLSQGRTREEALQNIREAIRLCLDVRRERWLPPTIQSLDVEIPDYA